MACFVFWHPHPNILKESGQLMKVPISLVWRGHPNEIIQVVGTEDPPHPRVMCMCQHWGNTLTNICTKCTSHDQHCVKVECPLPEEPLIRDIKRISPNLPVCSAQVFLVHKGTQTYSLHHCSKGIYSGICQLNCHTQIVIFINTIIYAGTWWESQVSDDAAFIWVLLGHWIKGSDLGKDSVGKGLKAYYLPVL